ncbi:MAG TPA: hypothetical protein VFI31_02465 [Pirellulales bacterium]|nr:hypothetical protein [Pirellulales bacterium]
MRFRDLIDRLRRVRRLRLQYGLRSLLLMTLAVCLVLGWYVERVRRQQSAVTALSAAGASIEYESTSDDPFADEWSIQEPATCREWIEIHTPTRLRDALGIDFFRRVAGVSFYEGDDYAPVLGRLRELSGLRHFSLHRPLDEDLIHVGALHSLTSFSPEWPFITDAGMVHLAGLERLEHLDLGNAAITDAGVAHLAGLRRLTWLNLHGTGISDAGMAHLADKLDLEYLDLAHTRITDKGLLELARLRHLEHLDLSGDAIGNAGLTVVSEMPKLRFLDLGATMITDEGLAPLRSLAAVNELNLSSTAITDKSLDVLGQLAPLKKVNIDNTAITPAGADALRDRSPALVTYDNHPDYLADSLTVGRIQSLMRVGRWSDALSETGKYQNSQFDYPNVLFQRAHCHAALEQWGEAERAYRAAFDEIAADPALEHWCGDDPWHELSRWPRLFERVAEACPDRHWQWMASARRAALAGQWSTAVEDYAHAAECPHQADPDREFEYALSRLLAGDTAEQQRVCEQLFAADRRAVEEDGLRSNWEYATHLSFVAPQGTVGGSQISDWLDDKASSWWKILKLQPLILCRAALFDAALVHKPPDEDEYGGRYWFARAMAQQHLGNCSEARHCLARGTRWLDRRRQADQVSSYFNDAPLLLEGEVLRREAERVIVE